MMTIVLRNRQRNAAPAFPPARSGARDPAFRTGPRAIARRFVCCAWVVGWSLALPGSARAQASDDGAPTHGSSSLMGAVTTLAVNALLGALTAGIGGAHGEQPGAAAPQRSFLSRFGGGALGGGVAYIGKRVAIERWDGAGIVGREIGAVGASIISNAAANAPLLSRVVLPAGPLRFYARLDGGLDVDVKLDLAAAVVTAYAAQRTGARLDFASSLSVGAPVFFTESHSYSASRGVHAFGVVMVEATQAEWDSSSETAAMIVAHETVHVLQHDFALQAWGVPAQRWLLERIPGGPLLHRYVDLGLHSILWAGLNAAVPYDSRPWEREAYFLSGRKRDDVHPEAIVTSRQPDPDCHAGSAALPCPIS